jgi:hypothetical protein
MARHLDSKLQRIIEDASNAQSSDTPHSSVQTNDFTHSPLNRYLGRRQPREEPNSLAMGFQTAHSVLDDFGKYYPPEIACHLADASDLG